MNFVGFLALGAFFALWGWVAYLGTKGPDPTDRVRDQFFAPAAWRLYRKVWPYLVGIGFFFVLVGIVALVAKALG
jgi:hypothetical protein